MEKFLHFTFITGAMLLTAACQSVPEASTVTAQLDPAQNQVVEENEDVKSFKFINRKAGNKICKSVTASGSRLQTEKLCKSEAEWAAGSDGASNGVREMQNSFNGAESP